MGDIFCERIGNFKSQMRSGVNMIQIWIAPVTAYMTT